MKISDIAKQTGLATSAIRFYERHGLMPKAERGSNGYRAYGEIDVQRLYMIRIAQSLGFTLDSIRGFFEATPGVHDDQVLQEIDNRLHDMDKMIAAMRAQRRDLLRIREIVMDSWITGDCIEASVLLDGMVTPLAAPALAAAPTKSTSQKTSASKRATAPRR